LRILAEYITSLVLNRLSSRDVSSTPAAEPHSGPPCLTADVWATLEFGGYSNITYASNETVMFAGPGIRYQDDEKSYGIHIQAPLSSPARDFIDLMVMLDMRFKF
jgi:hypothetical protein